LGPFFRIPISSSTCSSARKSSTRAAVLALASMPGWVWFRGIGRTRG
jgi:hypothetical protein